MNPSSNQRFKFFPQLNDLPKTHWLGSSNTLHLKLAETYFSSDSLQDTFVKAIATERLLPIKEVLETFEFFARVRKDTKTRFVADLCCGHGLLGILFAMFERKVDRVRLVDKKDPESRQKLLTVATRVAPWIAAKIKHDTSAIDVDDDWIEPGCAIVSAHACGILSDLCLDIAIRSGGPVAILPCCYPRSACRAPLALQTAFGLEAAFDIDRTYRLEGANYRVRWAELPPEITPMNRVLYAQPRSPSKINR